MNTGVKAFVFQYRFHGQQKRKTLGRYEEGQDKPLTVAGARTMAKEARRQVMTQDIDPMADREADRAEREADKVAPSVADLCDRYLDATSRGKQAKRERSQDQDRRMIETKVLPALGKMKVKDLTTTRVSKFLDDITAGKLPGQRKPAPYEANRVHSLLRHMLNTAVKWDLIERSPARDWERNEERHRINTLDQAGVKRLWKVLDNHRSRCSADAIKLLVLTGCRKNEVLGAKWSEFDLEARLWTIPVERHKSKHEHRVALDPVAVNLLAWRFKDNDGASEYVFPGETNAVPKKSVWEFFKNCCLAADIEPVRIHDLRHTHASLLYNANVEVGLIGAALGHSGSAMTAKYTHAFDDTKHKVAEIAGKLIAG
jgi:integrase